MSLKVTNRIFIALVVATNTIGNLFLAIGLARLPDFSTVAFPAYLEAFIENGFILGGIALMAVWMISQLSMYTWADLTYVLPVTASAYIFTALLGEYVLGEHISALRWAGVCVISIGVMFVTETPFYTERDPDTGKVR
jgi:drug/metabolite transporter (DMT)-like permease